MVKESISFKPDLLLRVHVSLIRRIDAKTVFFVQKMGMQKSHAKLPGDYGELCNLKPCFSLRLCAFA